MDFIINFSFCFSIALEPFFNAAASQFVLGHQIPLSLWLSLAPVVIGNFDYKVFCLWLYLFHCREIKYYISNLKFHIILGSRPVSQSTVCNIKFSGVLYWLSIFDFSVRCITGIIDRTFLQLDWVHKCNDFQRCIYLQKYLF